MEDNKTVSVAEVVAQPIGQEQLRQANLTLQKYKEGKANLEQRVIDNEEWYRLRHWECMRGKKKQQVEPVSAWLLNAIANKHADAMDNYPAPPAFYSTSPPPRSCRWCPRCRHRRTC